jgi:hypothetical protein
VLAAAASLWRDYSNIDTLLSAAPTWWLRARDEAWARRRGFPAPRETCGRPHPNKEVAMGLIDFVRSAGGSSARRRRRLRPRRDRPLEARDHAGGTWHLGLPMDGLKIKVADDVAT